MGAYPDAQTLEFTQIQWAATAALFGPDGYEVTAADLVQSADVWQSLVDVSARVRPHRLPDPRRAEIFTNKALDGADETIAPSSWPESPGAPPPVHTKGFDTFYTRAYEEGAWTVHRALEAGGWIVDFQPNHVASEQFPYTAEELDRYDVDRAE